MHTTNNPITIVGNMLYELGNVEQRRNISDWYINRQWYTPLGDYPMWVYVQPELAAQVWQYGVTVAAMDPDLVRDPYAEVMTDLAPAATLFAPTLATPKGVAVLPDGNIADNGMHLDSSTHDDALNRAAWGSITGVGQFPPLPAQFHGPNLELRITYLVNEDQK